MALFDWESMNKRKQYMENYEAIWANVFKMIPKVIFNIEMQQNDSCWLIISHYLFIELFYFILLFIGKS